MRVANQRFMIMVFLLFTLTCSSSILVRGQPRIIDISPGTPTPLSTIAFSVSDFGSANVKNVTLVVQECSNETSYENISYPMIGNQFREYHTNVTLTHEDATYILYHVECVVDGLFESTPVLNLDLEVERKTPGFEVIIVIGALVLVFLFRRRFMK